jgi:predicted nucleic acid-binding protein
MHDPATTIISDPTLIARGVELFATRSDKNWSLVDCISFVVMKQKHLKEALSADHHFVQAGFVALLR